MALGDSFHKRGLVVLVRVPLVEPGHAVAFNSTAREKLIAQKAGKECDARFHIVHHKSHERILPLLYDNLRHGTERRCQRIAQGDNIADMELHSHVVLL